MAYPAMHDAAVQGAETETAATGEGEIRAVPRIAVHAFCDTPEIAALMEEVALDRRMARTHMKSHAGGLAAATGLYGEAPTPNLIMVEARGTREEVLAGLDRLASVCDPGTKVVVIGHVNDVLLYRELLRRGVSEYMVWRFSLFDVIRTIADLYVNPESEPVGRSTVFLGAKGGVGSSTIAHNVGFSMARLFGTDVVVADLDLAFGTAGLDYNLDPAQGLGDALASPDRVDDVFLDRILAKCADHLSLLAAPATLDRTYDLGEDALEPVLDVVRRNVPNVVIDLPHIWSGWARKLLTSADEIIVTAAPDLANLRNAKNIFDQLKTLRPNDGAAKLVLSGVGMPRRPEIKADEFRKALEVEPIAIVPFDAQLFGAAANNGQMVAEINGKSPVVPLFDEIAKVAAGRSDVQKIKRSGLLNKLGVGRRKAG